MIRTATLDHDGFEDVIGCFSFGVRKQEGENMLGLCHDHNLEFRTHIERGRNISSHTRVEVMKVRLIINVLCRRHNEKVEKPLKSRKVGRATGPSGVTSNLIKAAGATGVKELFQVCESIKQESEVPEQ